MKSGKSGDWRIEFPRKVRRDALKLPESILIEAQDIILELAEDPYPKDSIPLRRHKRFRRIRFHWEKWTNPDTGRKARVPMYRLIYEVDDERRTVTIRRIEKRGPNTYTWL